LEEFGANPWEAVMVGDSVSDVKAARAAGTMSVIVRGGYTVVPAEKLGADIVIDGFRQLAGVLPTLKPAV
jgi:phosphoglycolate phosphatase